jgi:hypothetical protein
MNAQENPQRPVSVQPLPSLDLLASALGHAARWKILKELSLGEPRMVRELAKVIGCSPDMTSKHLAVLRKVGAVVQGRGSALPDSAAAPARARRTHRGLRPLPAPAGCGGIRRGSPAKSSGALAVLSLRILPDPVAFFLVN